MICNNCQRLHIGINILEKHNHCTRCGCPTKWNHRFDNPVEGSDKIGWWEETLTQELHWNRCDDFIKKCCEIKETKQDTEPVGQKTLPLQDNINNKNVGVTFEEESIQLLKEINYNLERIYGKMRNG